MFLPVKREGQSDQERDHQNHKFPSDENVGRVQSCQSDQNCGNSVANNDVIRSHGRTGISKLKERDDPESRVSKREAHEFLERKSYITASLIFR